MYSYILTPFYNKLPQFPDLFPPLALDARDKAVAAAQATTRKKVKPWDVTAVLAEMNGEQVTHSGAEL
jgi:hypothetical protein